MRCFVHFDFQMCISPQRHAILRHLNRQKWSKHLMFCAFWLANVLFATAAYNFWTSELQKVVPDPQFFNIFLLPNVLFATAAYNFSASELPKVVPDRQFFNIFTSECAFRHSGVQFLMSPFSTYLRTRRFNRPTFGLTRHTNLWKNTAFRDFSNIWRGCIFFLLTFWLLHLLSTDWLLYYCFSTLHIVGSFYLNFLRS